MHLLDNDLIVNALPSGLLHLIELNRKKDNFTGFDRRPTDKNIFSKNLTVVP